MTAGKSFVKLIKGVDYYLAISTENDKAATLTGDRPGCGSMTSAKKQGGRCLQDQEENGKIMLVLKLTDIDRYIKHELLNVDIILNSYEGLLVYESVD